MRELTNPCESIIECIRRSARNVKNWSSGEMAMRWTAAGMREAEKQFRQNSVGSSTPKPSPVQMSPVSFEALAASTNPPRSGGNRSSGHQARSHPAAANTLPLNPQKCESRVRT